VARYFSAKMVIRQGARWRIGTCANILLLGASWLKDGLSLTTKSHMYALLARVKVKDILDQTSKAWNVPLINILFDQNTAQLILNPSLQHLVNEDKLSWKAEKNSCLIFIIYRLHIG